MDIRTLAALSVVLVAACASAGGIVPATAQTITTGLALGNVPESAGDLWLDNRSSVAVTVVGVTLRGCVNVEETCDLRIPLTVKVEPGTREIVLRLKRKLPNDTYKLTFSMEWRADSTPGPDARPR